jgi:hypothetical protein
MEMVAGTKYHHNKYALLLLLKKADLLATDRMLFIFILLKQSIVRRK